MPKITVEDLLVDKLGKVIYGSTVDEADAFSEGFNRSRDESRVIIEKYKSSGQIYLNPPSVEEIASVIENFCDKDIGSIVSDPLKLAEEISNTKQSVNEIDLKSVIQIAIDEYVKENGEEHFISSGYAFYDEFPKIFKRIHDSMTKGE